MANISIKSRENQETQSPKLFVFTEQKSILRHYYIRHFEDRYQIRVYKITTEMVIHSITFIPVKVKKI